MKWHIEFYAKPKHVRITLSGTLRVDALRDVWTDIFSRGYWRKDSPIVFDLGDIEVDLSYEEVEAIVVMLEEIRGEFPGERLLIIAGSASQFGKTRQYQALAELREGLRVDIFRNEEEALKSLIADHP